MGKMTFVFEYEDGKSRRLALVWNLWAGRLLQQLFVMLSKSQKYVMR